MANKVKNDNGQARKFSYPNQVATNVVNAKVGLVAQLERGAMNRIRKKR